MSKNNTDTVIRCNRFTVYIYIYITCANLKVYTLYNLQVFILKQKNRMMSTCFFCVRRLQLPSNGFTCQALQMKISSSLWRPINKYLLPFGRDVKGCQKGSLWVSGEQLFAVRVAPLLKTKRKFNDLKFWKNASFDVNVDIWWYLCESGTFFCLFTRDILACLCSGIDLKVWWLITHIIHNKKGVIPKKNTHIIYTCAYIYIYIRYTVYAHVIYLYICVISSSSRCFSILPTQVTVQAHLYAPKLGLLLLDIRSQESPQRNWMFFSDFSLKTMAPGESSNVNLDESSKGNFVPYKCGEKNAFTKLVHLL